MGLRINHKAITDGLNKLGAQVHTTLDDGTFVTRDEALSDLIWKFALGWVEVWYETDDKGNRIRREAKHPPASWAMQYIVERREGKAAPAVQEENPGMKAADKVRELSKQRINALAKAAAPRPPVPLPKPKP